MQKAERLQKVLARAGFGSRRGCEQLIREGRVIVNGVVTSELGTRVTTGDSVQVDGKKVVLRDQDHYVMLHKPVGYVSTVSDPHGRPTVVDLVPRTSGLVPVGRLDVDSEGLLLLTDDGELTFRLTHPRFEIEKEYRVLVAAAPNRAALNRLRTGVTVWDSLTAPAHVTPLGRDATGHWLRFVIHEGRKRQVRLMCEAVGLKVLRLIRTRVGPLRLGGLRPGQHRALSRSEISNLRAAVGLAAMNLSVAIDGPAGSGKSALAVLLARRCGMLYLDTGAMYRAVTLLSLRRGIDPSDEASVSQIAEQVRMEVLPPDGHAADFRLLADGVDITDGLRAPEVDRAVSIVSAFRRVREALVRQQREIAARESAILVGRDIGTIVLPEAPVKIFLDASDEVRAQRRAAQLEGKGIRLPFEQVLAEMRLRDRLDSEREMSPLQAAPDAVVISTDQMTLEEEVILVEGLVRRIGRSE